MPNYLGQPGLNSFYDPFRPGRNDPPGLVNDQALIDRYGAGTVDQFRRPKKGTINYTRFRRAMTGQQPKNPGNPFPAGFSSSTGFGAAPQGPPPAPAGTVGVGQGQGGRAPAPGPANPQPLPMPTVPGPFPPVAQPQPGFPGDFGSPQTIPGTLPGAFEPGGMPSNLQNILSQPGIGQLLMQLLQSGGLGGGFGAGAGPNVGGGLIG